MNYLAHIYLSGEDEELIIGNYIADGLRSVHFKNYTPGIIKGVELHRFIDDYTDNHAIVKQSNSRLKAKYGRHSTVIIDIFYDHFLAKNWNLYHSLPLDLFAKNIYQVLSSQKHLYPKKAERFLNFMMLFNILVKYKNMSSIEKVLRGMTRRSVHNNNMYEAVNELKQHYQDFNSEFFEFFEDLRSEVQKFLNRPN